MGVCFSHEDFREDQVPPKNVVSPLHVNNNSNRTPTPISPNSRSSAASPSAGFAGSYSRGEKLGKGQYATVYKVSPRNSPDKTFAAKFIKKSALTPEDKAALSIEVKAMEMLKDHPNFVHLVQHFNEKDYFYIVLELIEGGELFDRICKKDHYTERDARVVMHQLASAIATAHMRGVCHRDLKPENILLASQRDDTTIKIADLGFAKVTHGKNDLLTTPCGTPGYVAPEVISGKPYNASCDVWSLGVILYILLVGYPPFVDDNQDALFKKIRCGEYSLESTGWSQISPSAKDLVVRMLTVEPARRITAEQVISHPWITMDPRLVPAIKLSGAQKEIRRLQARRRFKKAIDAVRVTVRMKLAMASREMKRARARGEDSSAAFFRAAQAGGEMRPHVERQLAAQAEFPDALVAGGRRVTTHQFRIGEGGGGGGGGGSGGWGGGGVAAAAGGATMPPRHTPEKQQLEHRNITCKTHTHTFTFTPFASRVFHSSA